MLDGNGLCCASGDLDECGVCDGDGSLCVSQMEAIIGLADTQISDADLTSCLTRELAEALEMDSQVCVKVSGCTIFRFSYACVLWWCQWYFSGTLMLLSLKC